MSKIPFSPISIVLLSVIIFFLFAEFIIYLCAFLCWEPSFINSDMASILERTFILFGLLVGIVLSIMNKLEEQ